MEEYLQCKQHLLENSMVEGIILSVTEKDRNDE